MIAVVLGASLKDHARRAVDLLGMQLTSPEPEILLVKLTPRLVLRVLVVSGVTFSGWWFDGEPVTDPVAAAEA